MCLNKFLLGLILYGTLCASWTCVTVSFPMLGNFSAIISSNIFTGPFCLSSPSGTHIMQMLVHLMLSQRSFKLFSLLFILFSLFCSTAVISTTLSSSSFIHSSASFILLLIPLINCGNFSSVYLFKYYFFSILFHFSFWNYSTCQLHVSYDC